MTNRLTHPKELLAANLAAAFDDDPVATWMFPEPDVRQRIMTGLFQHQIDEVDEVLASADASAVSLWAYRDIDKPEPGPPDPPAELADLMWRMAIAVETLETRHPRHRSHLYLPFIGVLPGSRGRGLGGRLLADRLERADHEDAATYLEASAPRNVRLYERHGFGPMGEPITLPEDGPVVQPMWRDPQN